MADDEESRGLLDFHRDPSPTAQDDNYVSGLKIMRTFQKVIFYLLLILLPSNLGKHFFFEFSFVKGILVDYLVPTIYLTDILVLILLGCWVWEGIQRYSDITIKRNFSSLYPYIPISLYLLTTSLSIFIASNQPAAFYKWLKLLELSLFCIYVSIHINIKSDFSKIVTALSVGMFIQSLLAIFQWINQGSILGYLFLGEQPYSGGTPGIAKVNFGGALKVPPYGTFSHPNVLGGYLAIFLPWVISALKAERPQFRWGRFFLGTVLILGISALFLTFSQAAWVVGELGIIIASIAKNFKFQISNFKFILYLFPFLFLLSLNPCLGLKVNLSCLRRLELNKIALKMIKSHPFLGVGLNNFTATMEKFGKVSGPGRFLQPVHNVFLLIASETGILGLLAFLLLLAKSIKVSEYQSVRVSEYQGIKVFLISLFQILLLSFVDHYFFTLQQGLLIFWLTLGLLNSKIRKEGGI